MLSAAMTGFIICCICNREVVVSDRTIPVYRAVEMPKQDDGNIGH